MRGVIETRTTSFVRSPLVDDFLERLGTNDNHNLIDATKFLDVWSVNFGCKPEAEIRSFGESGQRRPGRHELAFKTG